MDQEEMNKKNEFFKHKHMTLDIEHSLKYIDTFDEFEKMYTDELIDGNILLCEYMKNLLEKYNTSINELAELTEYSNDYIRKVIKGTRKNPERDFLLAICVSVRADVEETQTLLRYAGQSPLYARRKRDALIWYAIKKKQGITNLDIYLDERGYTMLKKSKDDEK